MQQVAAPKMIHRRLIHYSARALLFLLAIVLMWKMIWLTISLSSDAPALTEGDNKLGSAANPVTVEVYYESMCPDSKYFIREQLVPTIQKVPEIVRFKLVPYGKATTYENGTGIYFFCQHQELECQGNKIHACAIKYIDNQIKLLKFVSCLIKNIKNPANAAVGCAEENEVEYMPIGKCSSGREGSELLKVYGELTDALSPKVSFIPTVLINQSQGIQKDILKNLLKEVCDIYQEEKPIGCL